MDVRPVRIRPIVYQSTKDVKGHALADLIINRTPTPKLVSLRMWVLFFDGLTCDTCYGVGM
jgi:hypothetical protein